MMVIAGAFIDSGGAHTQDVYNFVASRQKRNIYAIKGASRPNRPIVSSKPTIVTVNNKGQRRKARRKTLVHRHRHRQRLLGQPLEKSPAAPAPSTSAKSCQRITTNS